MKNFTLVLLFLFPLFFTNHIQAQCPTGSVKLTTQAEVDQFVANYPNCKVIDGDLIVESDAITNISGLSTITTITGMLEVSYTGNLATIAFNQLTSLGWFEINGTAANSIKFEKLTTTNENAKFNRINNNSELVELKLPVFSSTKGILRIDMNGSLTELDLKSFREHGEDGHLSINSNSHLVSINLENLKTAGGLYIQNNISLNSLNLKSLSKVQSLTIINTGLTILDLTNLKEVNGSSNEVGKGFIISDNSYLESLNMDKLTNTNGHVYIKNNDQLGHLNSLENFTSLEGNLTISNNPNLTDCSGLCNLLNNNGVSGAITIENNPSECSSQTEVEAICNAPQCPTGDVILTTQAEVDQFVADYPNCETINGKLTIRENDITDISGLSNIKEIKGSFTVIRTNINTIRFDNLEITEGLDIYTNGKLKSVSATKLSSIKGSLYIQNSILKEVDLPVLITVTGTININNNSELENLNAENLTTSGSSIRFIANPKLVSVKFKQLSSSVSILLFKNNNTLKEINLPKVNATNIIDCYNNQSLELLDLANISNLKEIRIYNNNKLRQLNLSNLYSVTRHFTIANTELEYLTLPKLNNTGVDTDDKVFSINNNRKLISISFKDLKTVGNLSISDNLALKAIDLNNLEYITAFMYAHFTISRNNQLTSLNLDKLNNISALLEASFTINDTKLSTLEVESLNIFSAQDATFNILNNSKLEKINAPNIEVTATTSPSRKSYFFTIKNNPKLKEVYFEGLKELNSLLIIDSEIENLNTFQNLTKVLENLTISHNPNLTDCSGLCNLLNNNGVSGVITINNNPSECSSQTEVEASCTSLAVKEIEDNLFTVYPNPTHDLINIKNHLADMQYIITDMLGRTLQKGILKTNTIDISTFKNGVYYLSMVNDHHSEIRTIIKK